MASIQYVVNAVDSASGVFAKIAASADGLDKQLADLSKRVATPAVDLQDAKFTVGMIRAAERLDKLSAMVADPSVEVNTEKAQLEILRITAMLDRLDAKRVSVDVSVHQSMLSRVSSVAGGGGGIGGIAGAGGGALAAGAVIGPLLAGLAQVAGALAAAGAGVAAFGALSIPQFTAVSGAVTQISADTNAYERATTAASKATALKRIRQDWADINAPQRQAVKGIQGLQTEFDKLSAKLAPITFKVLNDGLKIANQLLPTLLPFARAAGNAIDGLLKSFDAFTRTAGFKAFLAQLQALSGPAITALGQGLGQIAVAVGKLILASAQPNSIKVLSGLLTVLAGTIGVITFVVSRASGKIIEWKNDFGDIGRVISSWVKNSNAAFAAFGDAVATRFDLIRHNVANFGHEFAQTFASLRASITTAWNTTWNNLVTRTQNGIADVVGWFRRMPGQVLSALSGLGHTLGSFASAALNEMWNGFKNVAGNILGWFKSFGSSIIGVVKKVLGVFSPSSVFFEIGKNLMEGLKAGVQHGASKAVAAAQMASHKVANAGAGVQRWAGLVRQALRMEGLSPGLLGNVLFQMQTESGGNPNAINLTDSNAAAGDPSRGLMQTIMSTFQAYHWPGTSGNIYDPLANIAAALNYARHRYGPSLMSGGMGIGSGHGYDYGGWLPPGVSLAVNQTGQPERVTSPAQEKAQLAVLYRIEKLLAAAPERTGGALGDALNGRARSARYSGMYSARGA